MKEFVNLVKEKVQICLRIAWLFASLKKTDKKYQYYNYALSEAKKSKDKSLIIQTIENGSNFYFNDHNYAKSLELTNEKAALDSSYKLGGTYYSDLGDLFRNQNQYEKADEYYLKAIKILESKKDSLSLMYIYHNYALIPKAKKKYKRAEEYYSKAKNLALILDPIFVHDCNRSLIFLYDEMKDYKSALKLINDDIVYYTQNKRLANLKDRYSSKAKMEFNLLKFKEAYKSIEMANVLRDSLTNDETQNKISLLESIILVEKKGKEIEFTRLLSQIFRFKNIFKPGNKFVSAIFV